MHLLIKQLLVTSIVASAVLFDQAVAECQKTYFRREIRDLSESELSHFTSTLWEFMSKDDSMYHDYAKTHNEYHNDIHGVPVFMPWHRVMLSNIENKIREIDPDFVFPYWDWSLDSQNPAASDILTDKYFGGNGHGANSCINSGPFKDHKPKYVAKGADNCLSRRFSNDTVTGIIGEFISTEVITALIQNTTDFNVFWPSIEGAPHGLVHNNIGAGFSTMFSPNDPLFYVHHGYVDKIWADWQEFAGDKADYTVLNLEEKLLYWDIPSSEVLQTEKTFCYKYAPPVKAYEMHQQNTAAAQQQQQTVNSMRRRSPNYQVTKPATPSNPPASSVPLPVSPVTSPPSSSPSQNTAVYSDSVNLITLRSTPKLPEAWCKMNGLNITLVREQERVNGEFVEKLNRIPNYVSPCALWNRESMMERLVETGKVKTFTVTMNGKTVDVPVTPGSNPTDAVARTKHSVIQAGIRVPNIVESLNALAQSLGTGLAQGLGQLLNITPLLGGLLQGDGNGLLNNVPIVSNLLGGGGGKLASDNNDTGSSHDRKSSSNSNNSNNKNNGGGGLLGGLGTLLNTNVGVNPHTSQSKLASTTTDGNATTYGGSAYGNKKYGSY